MPKITCGAPCFANCDTIITNFLIATRRAALKLLLTVGLGEAAGGESEDEEDGSEDEDGEEGEEEEGEEEEDDDDNCAVPVEPLAKRSRV